MTVPTWEECAAAGMTKAEAAKARGVTWGTADWVAKDRGLTFAKRGKPRLVTPEIVQFVHRHWRTMSDAEIGREVGLSEFTVRNVRRDEGLIKPNLAPASSANRIAIPAAPKGYSDEQIAWAEANAMEGVKRHQVIPARDEASLILLMHQEGQR